MSKFIFGLLVGVGLGMLIGFITMSLWVMYLETKRRQ